ncbi:hypothetical protein [Demequina zhanjiangensis]|uniref:Sulfotransferase family protein n=1 Tax=Demequina zhanjiangensis TaxID=3051659 RepID=A0ABT8G4A6_9MICO|nr:hypothetical protein [Demequina sp. SYSU T00b26]MDN4473980.1 hypothetical protein [Demequina sp. SYSU T00b26]
MAATETFADRLPPALAVKGRMPVVINSFGRSGSTVLFRAVSESHLRPWARTPARVQTMRANAWDLSKDPLEPRMVYKSHDLPRDEMAGRAKVVYVFGDPIAATRSAIMKGQSEPPRWFEAHCAHLHQPLVEPEALYETDALKIGAHLRAWLDATAQDVAFVRYERLWERIDDVSSFLGFRVTLPEYRARSASAEAPPDIMVQAYAEATALVDALPDFVVSRPGSSVSA